MIERSFTPLVLAALHAAIAVHFKLLIANRWRALSPGLNKSANNRARAKK